MHFNLSITKVIVLFFTILCLCNDLKHTHNAHQAVGEPPKKKNKNNMQMKTTFVKMILTKYFLEVD